MREMREPGTSFEYKGITLHVVKSLTDKDACFGCFGEQKSKEKANKHCRSLARPDDRQNGLCGTMDDGVVFVRNIKAFKLAAVAHILSE